MSKHKDQSKNLYEISQKKGGKHNFYASIWDIENTAQNFKNLYKIDKEA